MDGPYDRWQKRSKELTRAFHAKEIDLKAHRARTWTFKGMLLNGCNSAAERAACVLGKLNQQIDNGGFAQWVDNRYAIESWDLLPDVLNEMGPVSKKVLAMCRQMMKLVGVNGDFGDDDDDWEHTIDLSDRLSSEFYKLKDEWHPEVYAYLEKLEESCTNVG